METEGITTGKAATGQGQSLGKVEISTDVGNATTSNESCQGTGNFLLDAALAYAAKSWPIYPAREKDETLEAFVQRIKHLPEAEQKKKSRRKAKSPYIRDQWNVASTDPDIIREWWTRWPNAMIGLATGPRAGVFVLDSDKPDGEKTVATLAERYGTLPPTLTVESGRGGTHRYFRWPTDGRIVRSREGDLGANLDVRGHAGGIMLPPTIHPCGFSYKFVGDPETPIAEMPPAWLDAVSEDASVIRKREDDGVPLCELDQPDNVERGRKYLRDDAPEAIAGTGQHKRTFNVAARLRELGLSQDTVLDLMVEEYNDRKCFPPMILDDLAYQIDCAFQYAKSPWGGDTPEGAFAASPVDETTLSTLPKAKPNVIDELNANHAFTLIMGKPYVVRENVLVDDYSDPITMMTERGFTLKYGNKFVLVPDGDKRDSEGNQKMKQKGVGAYWLTHNLRRTVEKIDFYPPPKVAPPDHINLYRGTSLKPTETPQPERCAKFTEFIKSHICNGNEPIYRYVLAWIADLVQNPGGRKPGDRRQLFLSISDN